MTSLFYCKTLDLFRPDDFALLLTFATGSRTQPGKVLLPLLNIDANQSIDALCSSSLTAPAPKGYDLHCAEAIFVLHGSVKFA